MPRLRSVVVVALMWMAAFAASSAPDGFGGAPLAGAITVRDAAPGGSTEGKRWAVVVPTAAAHWDLPSAGNGKRWD